MTAKTTALLRSLFGKDEKGNVYLRVVAGEPDGLENAVNTQSNRTLESLLSSAIVLDEDGNPALRLAEVQFGKTLEQAEKERRLKMEKQLAANKAEQAKLHNKKTTEEA